MRSLASKPVNQLLRVSGVPSAFLCIHDTYLRLTYAAQLTSIDQAANILQTKTGRSNLGIDSPGILCTPSSVTNLSRKAAEGLQILF